MISCHEKKTEDAPWILDRFDDIKILRYEVSGFAELPLREKELIYYLAEAAKCGRDIMFDQNFKYNLPVRRTLEVIYENYDGDRTTPEWKALEKYLKKVWFANGIHHHYSNDKFVPEFPKEYFLAVAESIPVEKFGDELNALRAVVCEAIFNPELYKTQLNQAEGQDLVATSANNYYEGVTQAEAEDFYRAMADPADPEPVSYGLNSKLVKDEDGTIRERAVCIRRRSRRLFTGWRRRKALPRSRRRRPSQPSSTITKPATCTISTVITSCGCGIPYPTSIS